MLRLILIFTLSVATAIPARAQPDLQIQVLNSLFFRNKGAYVIARVQRGDEWMPVVLPLLHGPEGILVDAVLTTSDEVSIVFGFSLGLLFSGAMVIIASISILYNTSNVLHRYNPQQHVAAALSLFASVALLFWYILRIFMGSSRRS